MKTARFLMLLAAVVSLNLTVFGQTATTARITGQVTDAQGAVVVGATVKLVDKATNAEKRTATTNDEGRFVFPSLDPGDYDIVVTKPGFRKGAVAGVRAEVSKSLTVDITIQPGGTSEQVTITATGEVQLQRDDSAVGNVIDQDRISRLPNADRQATSLLTLQPGVTPGGEVTGARADQNTFNLDGVDVSDNVIGLPFRVVIPVTTESLEELRSTVSNPNATFGRSSGSQVTLVTKRGTSQFHGSLYEYHQDRALTANTWDNNRLGLPNPPLVDNRFGTSIGGPIWKDKIFFFFNWEERRRPDSIGNTRLVPTQSLRDGTLKFLDASGGVLSVKPGDFDPRHIGSNPSILKDLNQMPLPNNFSVGDGLNTAGFTHNYGRALRSDFGVLRLDGQVSKNWAVEAKGAAQRLIQTDAFQVDLVHLKGGTFDPERPRNLTFAVIGSIRPNLVNEVRYGYIFDSRVFGEITPTTIAGFNVAAKVGPLALLDDLIDVDTQRARFQSIFSGTNQFIDNATWSKGTHTLQFGGDLRRITTFHERADKVVGSLSTPVAQIGANGNLSIDAAQRPATCGGSITQNCIQPGDVQRYNGLYSTLLGMVDSVSYLAVRDASLNPLPPGTNLINDTLEHHWEFYVSDVWRMKPAFTLSYGLLYQWHTPPADKNGKQTVAVYKDTGKLVDPIDYLKQKAAAANNGDIFNPDLAYIPIKQSGFGGVFETYRKDFSPRISLAWQPSFKEGVLGRVFGDNKTVIRGGYALVYDRPATVATVIVPMLGVGFAQTLNIRAPKNSHGDPFRAGIDGDIPVPANFAVKSPVVPSKPFGELLSFLDDPKLKDPRNHSIDFTIQRELPGRMLLEVGYVGRLARELYQSYNLNSNPYFFKDKKSGQRFAAAFDALATQLRSGVAPNKVAAQPWFENQLGSGGTQLVAENATGDLIAGNMNNMWNLFLDFVAPNPYNSQQSLDLFYRSNGGRSNYHALLISLHKRNSHGLTFDINYTLSKSLDQVGAVQNSAGELSTSFFPDVDYGPSFYDRRHIMNANWVYDLPFGSGRRFSAGNRLNKLIGGWFLSGIFHAESAQPLDVTQNFSAQVFGASVIFGYGQGAIGTSGAGLATGLHGGVSGSGGVGTNGSPAGGGSGLNLFSNPEQASKDFRPILVSQDGRAGRGTLRGLSHWQVDMSLGKTTKIGERMQFGLTFDVFNVFNHVNFQDPSLNLEDPASFGVISQQIVPNPNGFPLAQTFYRPRAIQIGARFQF